MHIRPCGKYIVGLIRTRKRSGARNTAVAGFLELSYQHHGGRYRDEKMGPHERKAIWKFHRWSL